MARAEIRVFQFQPGVLAIRAGTRVTWTNADDITHTVTSGMPGSPDGRFDVSLAGQGRTGSATFSEPGTYPYFCARHQSMRGEVLVR
jgi:plastocyanin